MDTIEAMQHEIDELKAEVLRLKREAGNIHARHNSHFLKLNRMIEWQRIQLDGFVMGSFDQYDEQLWGKINQY
jgi:hypothetical protein